MAPSSKPVVAHQVLPTSRIMSLSGRDTEECNEWLSSIGWGGETAEEDGGDSRIRVSGDRSIDDMISYEHTRYKATGSIEAQARIDR